MEIVREAIKLAVARFGGEGGIFNSANFSVAMRELSGVEQTLDGKMVTAILSGRPDVEPLSGGAHWKFKTLQTDEVKKGVRIICVDFDGVLHGYQSGWKGADVIPDPPVPGAFEWLTEMTQDSRFQICVYSSRSKVPNAIEAMIAWFVFNGLSWETISRIRFPTQKPAAVMTIDDRAFCFEGKFPSKEWLIGFKPWNKRG